MTAGSHSQHQPQYKNGYSIQSLVPRPVRHDAAQACHVTSPSCAKVSTSQDRMLDNREVPGLDFTLDATGMSGVFRGGGTIRYEYIDRYNIHTQLSNEDLRRRSDRMDTREGPSVS